MVPIPFPLFWTNNTQKQNINNLLTCHLSGQHVKWQIKPVLKWYLIVKCKPVIWLWFKTTNIPQCGQSLLSHFVCHFLKVLTGHSWAICQPTRHRRDYLQRKLQDMVDFKEPGKSLSQGLCKHLLDVHMGERVVASASPWDNMINDNVAKTNSSRTNEEVERDEQLGIIWLSTEYAALWCMCTTKE